MPNLVRRCAAIILAAHVSIAAANGQLPPVRAAGAAQILADVRSGPAQVTVVHFWTTWCIPCRDEVPSYVRLGREFRSLPLRILFVSTDFAESLPEVRQHLAGYGVKGASYVRSGTEREFFRSFHANWSGGLPATVLFGPNGNVLEFWEGTLTYETLKERVARVISAPELPNQRQRSEDR